MGSEHGTNCIGITLLFFFIWSVNVSSSFKVSMNLSRQRNRDYNEQVGIICNSTTSLEKCQFRVVDLATNSSFVFDSRGGCGMKLSGYVLEVHHLYAVVCRARSDSSDWVYDSMSVYKSQTGTLQIKQYLEVHAIPGYDVNVTLKSDLNINRCQLKLPQKNLTLNSSTASACSSPYCVVKPNNQNTCVLNITNATNHENGILLFSMANIQNDYYNKNKILHLEKGFLYVIVAKPPIRFVLSNEISEDQNGTRTLIATCLVTGSRPAAILSWYLGGERVLDERVRSVAGEEWLWPFDEQTTLQKMTLILTDEHLSKVVKCEASHSGLRSTMVDEFVIQNESTSATTEPTDTTSILSENDGKPSSESQMYHYKVMNDRLRVFEKKTAIWFPVITALLVILLLLVIALTVGYYLHTSPFSCCRKPTRTGVVKYRRSLEPSLDYAEEVNSEDPPCQVQITDSSPSRSSVATGVEFAEIRASMVQRCVDKINAGRPSSETGEVYRDTMMRTNSIYMSYGDQPM